MADKLTVKGLGAADGTYEFDLASLVSINGAEALSLREQQRVKILSGYRGLEIREAVGVLDPAMMVALVEVIVTRGGKTVNATRIWDAKMLYTSGDEVADLEKNRVAVNFHMDGLAEDDETIEAEDAEEGEETHPPT